MRRPIVLKAGHPDAIKGAVLVDVLPCIDLRVKLSIAVHIDPRIDQLRCDVALAKACQQLRLEFSRDGAQTERAHEALF